MKKKIAWMLMICILATVFFMTGSGIDASAAGTTTIQKKSRTYEIAVVFDNSGSMYNDESWCRAKYAMEIFASMLNYENGDVLKIFPMWEVTTSGGMPKSGGSFAPLTIKDIDEIDDISNMFTPEPGNTPMIPIKEAEKELASSGADEKWLIVLTDGAFNLTAEKGRSRDDNDTEHIDVSVLQTMLEEIVGIKNGGGFQSTGIKVQYLGIGKAEKVEENKDCNLHAKLSTATSLKDDLIKICNDIFKRSELPSKFINGNEITINLSMRNVIVFAQGEGATISGLKTPGGDDVDDVSDSGQRKYSEISAWWGDTNEHAIDTSLAGQVVTFSACPTSTEPYILECTGAEKVQVFYEPDVEIELSLIGGTDDNGNPIKVDITSGEVNPGEYTVEYKIVDAVTKEDAVKSGLMGNSIEFSESYIENSKGKKEFKSGDKVTFEPDEETEIVVTGTYLEDYTISTKDNPWAFPKFKVNLPETKTYDVKLSTAQIDNWYVKSNQANWKPIIAELTVDGAPLTDEELAKVDFSLEFSPDITYSKKRIPGKSAYEIYLCTTETGADVTPETGKYTVKAKAVFTDENGDKVEKEDKLGFNIELYSVIWKWLIWLIALLIIILIIWFILSRKAWPKSMRFESTNSSNSGKIIVNKSLNLLSNAYINVSLQCEAEKNSTLYRRNKKTASIKITKVTPSYRVLSYSIGGKSYSKKENGIYSDRNGKEFEPKIVTHRTKVEVTVKDGRPIEGLVYINSRKK